MQRPRIRQGPLEFSSRRGPGRARGPGSAGGPPAGCIQPPTIATPRPAIAIEDGSGTAAGLMVNDRVPLVGQRLKLKLVSLAANIGWGGVGGSNPMEPVPAVIALRMNE